jgi:hypothetical protein
MLDELDAMAAEQREAARKSRGRRRTPAAPARVTISYWSIAEQRWKTRTTTCIFRPTKET